MHTSATTWSLPREKFLTREEVTRILSAAKKGDGCAYVFLVTAANTALRLCEVIHIRKSDLQDGRLQVTRRKKRTPKPEVIDVTPALWSVLEEWGQMFEDHQYIFPGNAGACFVRHTDGRVEKVCHGAHVSRRSIQRRWMLLLKAENLYMKNRGIHSLRHFGVTEFYAATRDLRAAQMFAGHSSSTMTERYAHVVDMKEKVHAMKALI